MPETKTKKCAECKKDLPIDQFRPDARTSDSLNKKCRICTSATHRIQKQIDRKREILAENELEIPVPKVMDVEGCEAVVNRIMDEEKRGPMVAFLSSLLQGDLHRRAMDEAGYKNWNSLATLFSKTKGLKDLYIQCKEIGEEYRRILRLDAAHLRAVEGADEPIYSASGKFLGNRKVYSDRLLELLLKADNPDHFRDKPLLTSDGTVLNITLGFDRKALKEEQKQEATDAEFEELD